MRRDLSMLCPSGGAPPMIYRCSEVTVSVMPFLEEVTRVSAPRTHSCLAMFNKHVRQSVNTPKSHSYRCMPLHVPVSDEEIKI
jgi:hypothetical protein